MILFRLFILCNLLFSEYAYVGSFTGKEHALVISNHRSDIDWLVGWILAQVHIVHYSVVLIILDCWSFCIENEY